VQRIFVKVIGFDDVERHALNTLFRLSEEREVGYALWQPDLGLDAQLLLVDSDSHEARIEFESPTNADLKAIWVGPGAPERAWRSFPRPVQWSEVVATMDRLFQTSPDIEVGLDLDLADAQDTQPPEPAAPARRALIACADRDERLYLRARLALADLTQADEAENAADALELARRHQYTVALVDFALPGQGGWELVRQFVRGEPRIPCLIVTKEHLSAAERLRSWWGSGPVLLSKPVEPAKLKALLGRV